MNVKSSFYNEYDIKNNEKPVFWAQRSFQNHHQTFHDRCPEKIGPLPKKSDHWSTRTCPENIRPAPTWTHASQISERAKNSKSKYKSLGFEALWIFRWHVLGLMCNVEMRGHGWYFEKFLKGVRGPCFRNHTFGYGDGGPKSYPCSWKIGQTSHTLDKCKYNQNNYFWGKFVRNRSTSVKILLTCTPRRSIEMQFFWSARKCI